jgi:hypothetical protein
VQNLSEGYIVELRFVLDAPMVYETTNVVEFGAADAAFNLSNGQLRVRPHGRENSVALIRSRVEPVLRGWEFQETLVFGFAPPRFAFVDAEIVGDITSVQLDTPDKLLHDDPQVGEIQITVNHFCGFLQAFVRVLRRRRRWLAQTRVGAHSRPLFDFGLAVGRLNRAGKGNVLAS